MRFAEYVKNFFIMAVTWVISVGDIFRGTGENKIKEVDNSENKVCGHVDKKKRDQICIARNPGSGPPAGSCTSPFNGVRPDFFTHFQQLF